MQAEQGDMEAKRASILAEQEKLKAEHNIAKEHLMAVHGKLRGVRDLAARYTQFVDALKAADFDTTCEAVISTLNNFGADVTAVVETKKSATSWDNKLNA